MFRSSAVMSFAVLAALVATPHAQTPTVPPGAVAPALFSELTWRMIGPHRASRTSAITGVVQEAHTFYIGVSNGGVWKTTDAGRTWLPIFEQVEGADLPPTPQLLAAWKETASAIDAAITAWERGRL